MISGQGNVNASDIEVRMQDGASIGGVLIDRSVHRVALIGGHYTGTVEMSMPSVFWPSRVDNPAWVVTDVMIDGVSVRSTNNTAFFLRGHRVALVHSFGHGADYGPDSDTTRDQSTDVIIAGNQLEAEGRQATLRLINVRNAVAVENRLTDLMLTGEKHNFRVHGTSTRCSPPATSWSTRHHARHHARRQRHGTCGSTTTRSTTRRPTCSTRTARSADALHATTSATPTVAVLLLRQRSVRAGISATT